MPKTIVKVSGLRELEAALSELPKSVGKAVLRRVLAKAAAPIEATADRLAPSRDSGDSPKYYGGKVQVVDGRRRRVGGKLRRIGTGEALVQAGIRLTKSQARKARKAGKSTVEYYVGTRDPAAKFYEYGTANAPAQPFLRPAWDRHKGEALDIIKDELGREIETAAARVAKRRPKAKTGG